MALGVKGNLRGDRIRIALSMSEKLFDRINARALRKSCSFNAEAIRLLDCGLFDYEESESLDPVSEMAEAEQTEKPAECAQIVRVCQWCGIPLGDDRQTTCGRISCTEAFVASQRRTGKQ